MLVVGYNSFGEFGLDKTKTFNWLTLSNTTKAIRNIHSGYKYNILTVDADYDPYYVAAGYNVNGQCGIGEDKDCIKQYKQINYFNREQINIKQICINVSGQCVFWISDQNKVYGNGINIRGQLGLGDTINRGQPAPINYLNISKDIIQVQSALNYSVAICRLSKHTFDMIIGHWSKLDYIPSDIVNLIVSFYGNTNKVYSTQHCKYNEWKEINFFEDKHVIKIRTGLQYSLFLDLNGFLWSSGDNNLGQLGVGHNKKVNIPTMIANKIRIRDIKCGSNHNLAIDYNHKVYSWGNNKSGECGHGNNANIYYSYPQIIRDLKDYQVIGIECGYKHSYCKTSSDQHYLFGSNYYNECIAEFSIVIIPNLINPVIEQNTNGKKIKLVSLGYQNTKIVLQ